MRAGDQFGIDSCFFVVRPPREVGNEPEVGIGLSWKFVEASEIDARVKESRLSSE